MRDVVRGGPEVLWFAPEETGFVAGPEGRALQGLRCVGSRRAVLVPPELGCHHVSLCLGVESHGGKLLPAHAEQRHKPAASLAADPLTRALSLLQASSLSESTGCRRNPRLAAVSSSRARWRWAPRPQHLHGAAAGTRR